MAKEIHFRQTGVKSKIHYRPASAKIPETVDFPATEAPMMFRAASEPSALEAEWKAWKEHALFPAEEGYGPERWTKPTREEQLYRGLTFIPQKVYTGLGSAIERFVETVPAGYVKPLFRAIGKGRLERVAFEELHPKKFAESIAAAGRTAFRKPGVPAEAPTFGKMLAEEWYEPMVGKEPPTAYTPVMNAAFDVVMLFGPQALRARSARQLAAADKITTKYNEKIKIAQSKGDTEAVKSLRAMEQQEIGQVLGEPIKVTKPAGLTKRSLYKLKAGEEPISKSTRVALRDRGFSMEEIARLSPKEATRLAARTTKEAAKVARAAEQAPKAARGAVPTAREAVEAARKVPEAAREAIEAEKPIGKLTRLIKEAKKVQPQYEKIKHIELKKRAAAVSVALKEHKGEEAWTRAYAAAKGRIDAPDFTPPGLSMSAAEKASLSEQLRLSKKFLPFEYLQAKEGLNSLLAGYKPQPGQTALLEREFGTEVVKALLSFRTLPQKLKVAALDVANMPRTFLTSYDLSASLRQGYIAGLRHPKEWSHAFVAQVKALTSEKNALAIENSIRTSKYWPEALKYKLYQPSVTGVSEAPAARPEEFMSQFARAIPGVKASERAFVTFGNKIRMDLFSKTMNAWRGTGKTAKDYKLLAGYINAVTGRGKLPLKFLEENGAAMNAIFFSPRWVSSRIQLLGQAAKAIPWAATGGMIPAHPVSKMAAADIVTLVGANTSIMAAMKFYWEDKVDIELDPRSPDFGKIRVGNSRWEAFAGYQPLARYTAQALTGERKQALTGRMFETTPTEIGARFLRSKLSPVSSFVVDMTTGTTFIGDEMSMARLGWTPPEEAKTPFQKQAGALAENILFNRFFPIVGQDILDAAIYQGAGETAIIAPAVILGIGGGTWPPSKGQQLALLQDDESRKRYGKPWNDTGPLSQQLMKNINSEWEELDRAIKYERQQRGITEVDKREQNEAGRNVYKNLTSPMKQYMKEFKVPIGGLSRKLGEWRLNDERYTRYQELVTNNINQMISEEEKKPDRQLIENIIRIAKEMARNKIVLDANIGDE